MWLDPESHASANLLAQAIKISLEKGVINEEDLFTNDEYLINKLRNSRIKEINDCLNKLVPEKTFVYTKKEEAEYFGPNKPRYVDPLVYCNKSFLRVSDLVPSLKYYFEEFTQNYKFIGVKQIY